MSNAPATSTEVKVTCLSYHGWTSGRCVHT